MTIDEPVPEERAMHRMYLGIMYASPWERIMLWAQAIDGNNEIRKQISDRPWTWRNLLAGFAERRHQRWLTRWADRGVEPPARWRRQAP